jgi:hypothetical protein
MLLSTILVLAALPTVNEPLPPATSNNLPVPAARPVWPGRVFPFPGLPALPPLDPLPPSSEDPPVAPKTVTIVSRQADSIGLTWRDASDHETANVVERRIGSGPWQDRATFGAVSGWTDFVDDDIQPDTEYCYRIRSSNAAGTNRSQKRCAYTPDGTNRQLWRAQLTVGVADVSNAGTDDAVVVRLNSPGTAHYLPALHETWTDYSRDDFERGSRFTYDLVLDGLTEFSDITMLSLHKDGTDGLCIEDVELIINDVPVFDAAFDSCHWIDGDDGHSDTLTFFHDELRAHPHWQSYETPYPPFEIPREEIVSRVEAMVGHSIHGTDLYWGNSYGNHAVEVGYVADDRLHVNVDLAADAPLGDPDVGVDFDLALSVTCSGDDVELDIRTENFDVHSTYGFYSNLGQQFLCVVDGQWDWDCIEETIEDDVRSGWNPVGLATEFSAGGICPSVSATPRGDIEFSIGS